ncbi:MAG: bifunctional phosphoribosyl-AMP cyclohydrolase/phosphoribosyl-ATP diphosphatase HisIE [Crocinitomicaceae bacterium]|nr:bifunctional phosphoribosyl-AMP cyclohydrolase/phosphoribosyl-ATP diphosphatase HisIE [Crocinitomicaceae bacterium]MBK8926080.1 bifunctional phosphoribosyl-AMP cyclohydrolase/phosphoribosyl-ATP diphosphatase HisIE [Crocinitomicaceae bacterium]
MKPDFTKENGLVPVIVQDSISMHVLMLGYMNEEAFAKTLSERRVTFFSRSKNRLWTKGETSGNFLNVENIRLDCDQDAILISATPNGPTCHTGSQSCFGDASSKGFIYQLEKTISERIDSDDPNSYTNKLYKRGINKVAQKVGEEAVELVIESKDQNDELFLNEAADLMYHFLILLKAKNLSLSNVEDVLAARSK